MQSETGNGPPRALLIAAIAVATGALIAVLVIAALRQPGTQPVPIAAVPAPEATGAECAALTAALPESLGDVPRAPVLDPAPAGTAAWRGDDGGEPIILRCGLDRPVEFVVGAPLQAVDDVQWFRIADATDSRSTWYTVDRAVYVALTLPRDSGPTPIQQISAAIAKSLPARPLDPAPVS